MIKPTVTIIQDQQEEIKPAEEKAAVERPVQEPVVEAKQEAPEEEAAKEPQKMPPVEEVAAAAEKDPAKEEPQPVELSVGHTALCHLLRGGVSA